MPDPTPEDQELRDNIRPLADEILREGARLWRDGKIFQGRKEVDEKLDKIMALITADKEKAITDYIQMVSTDGRPLNAEPLVINQPAACQDCGSDEWPDWYLYPHQMYNSICPGGTGYLCFPCFCKRAIKSDIEKTVREATLHGRSIGASHYNDAFHDLPAPDVENWYIRERDRIEEELAELQSHQPKETVDPNEL